MARCTSRSRICCSFSTICWTWTIAGYKRLLREVSSDTLAVALRGAEPEVQEKILRNMSKRAAEILKDDMEARGPVKLTDVEAAQKEIIVVAQRLAEEGTISLGGKAGGEFV